ncbi:hypothetical protein FBEOM_2075 [Fusarium beomiforme]|uniref:Uncharacterized protein n=1 Tax=Fusarium beomiforme TaxID=44412 RepID=A0A9P5AS61_9HYPO|nr:hypothetical protein FBEOM_2075 [Fusarium beomiforme]
MPRLVDLYTAKLVCAVCFGWGVSIAMCSVFDIKSIIHFSVLLGCLFFVLAAGGICIAGLSIIAIFLSCVANAAIICLVVLLIPALQMACQKICAFFYMLRRICNGVIRFFESVIFFFEAFGDAVQRFPQAFDRLIERAGAYAATEARC